MHLYALRRCAWSELPEPLHIYKYSHEWVTGGISTSNARPWIQGWGWTTNPETQTTQKGKRWCDEVKNRNDYPLIPIHPRTHTQILFTIQHVQGSNRNSFIIQCWWSCFQTLGLFLHFNCVCIDRRIRTVLMKSSCSSEKAGWGHHKPLTNKCKIYYLIINNKLNFLYSTFKMQHKQYNL